VADTIVKSRSLALGARRTVTLAIETGRYQVATFGAEWKDLDEQIFQGGAGAPATSLTYLPLSASYFGSVDDAAGRWLQGGTLTIGLRRLVNDEGEFRIRRYQASATFASLKLDLTREHKLPLGMTLRVRGEGQLAVQPLVPTEQFSAGGVDSVRGYAEAAVVGDTGLRGSIELRSRELAAKEWSRTLTSLVVHGFVEGAYTEARNALPEQIRRFGLLGAGFGLRARGPWLSSLALDLGWPLRDLVTGQKSDGSGLAVGSTSRGDLKVHATASLEF
jgi:hemolysin activation/secretion protein